MAVRKEIRTAPLIQSALQMVESTAFATYWDSETRTAPLMKTVKYFQLELRLVCDCSPVMAVQKETRTAPASTVRERELMTVKYFQSALQMVESTAFVKYWDSETRMAPLMKTVKYFQLEVRLASDYSPVMAV